nr:Chain C, Protein E6 [human papillomavirus 18]4JOR_D Chain D, Protein E6 [human papillomavirus 18]5IC3_C Chain C, HPV18E6 Peptide [Alphapapillomavirus 7]5IC3_D Chain D, HPV18E6 Peptide [Alphapapillomavirus 7]5K4F_C Chain C, HPV18E6 peptide [human papillomavirus 18]5K4F_D Chain D, HPV18E6 peptide [human papillomavirus 18]8B82_C Chain C, Protein E6 [human papillomavirus 18]8B82_D Chain D, Protein E6 [human papillomavirus 18]
RLQRRRETQV